MDCSAIGFVSGALRASVVLATWLGVPGASAATSAEFDDAQTRIQYGFLTNDARAIQAALQEVARYEVDDRLAPLKSYQLAFGHWKLAQVHARANGGVATKAAKTCIEHARAAHRRDPRMAEAYALEAICDEMPRGYMRLAGLTRDCTRSRPLRMALSLEPENPRVLLIEAMCAGDKDAAGGVARWRKVVDAFGAASSAGSGRLDWGEAEALVLLGEHHLQRGEMLAAREALEKALVLAPDYDAARELLGSGASQAR